MIYRNIPKILKYCPALAYVYIDGCNDVMSSYSILTPLQAIGILIWYIVREIIENEEEKWYRYSRASLIMVLTQVAIICIHTYIHM